MKYAIFVCALLLVVSVVAIAGSEKPATGYRSIEIVQFTIKPGVGFPQDYMSKMQADLINEINARKKFQAFATENKPADYPQPCVKLVGEVTEYKAGNQAMRYMVGFGAGKTKIVAHVKFIDPNTNQVVFEKDVDGKVIMGLLGGTSGGATRGLAKEVAKVAEDKLSK